MLFRSQLAQYRAGGVTFADQDVGSMVAALNRAVREFDGLRAKSVSASAAWRARHCPSSFVDQLLGLSLMAGGADPI